jgi:glyoxalase family protein
LRFYRGVLGMRLVKKSVNQDDPGTYHLFYADGVGNPGTDITFFPWAHARAFTPGVGLVGETYLTVPHGTLPAWEARLAAAGVATAGVAERFGERRLGLRDPHGLRLALIEGTAPFPFTPHAGSTVPEHEQIRALHGAEATVRDLDATGDFLEGVLGFTRIAREGDTVRFALPGGPAGGGGHLLDLRADASGRRGAWGVGSVHHLAWTVRDDAHQEALRAAVAAAGRRPSDAIDRFWFKSVYFMEPGGLLFELATAGPGFAVDEAPEALGERLILPPWLEPHRAEIESVLPDLTAAAR